MRVLTVQGLTKRFGGLTAVRNVDFHVDQNEIVSLIGPNGAGKTTTFNMIAGSLAASEGSIKFKEHELIGKKPFEIAKMGIARTFQITSVFLGITVLENVITACHRNEKSGIIDTLFVTKRYLSEQKELPEKAMEALKFVGLEKRSNEIAANLAYGELRLLEIAIALATLPELVLLDEPAAGMNPEETNKLIDLIAKIRDSGITVLLVEHNMNLVMKISDRIIVLDHGELIARGLPEEIAENPKVIEAYLGRGADNAIR